MQNLWQTLFSLRQQVFEAIYHLLEGVGVSILDVLDKLEIFFDCFNVLILRYQHLCVILLQIELLKFIVDHILVSHL